MRVVDAGPRYFYRSALASLAVTCSLAILIVRHVRPPGPLPGAQQTTITLALAGLCVVAFLALAGFCRLCGVRGRWLDRVAAPDQRAAIWLALTGWFPLLLVPAYLRARATLPQTVTWINFGYLDKRWVTSTYLVGALAPMLLLVVAARVLVAGRGRPPTWRSWLRGLAPWPEAAAPHEPPRPGTVRARWRGVPGARAARVTAGVVTSLAVAWYFYGPPWFLGRPGASGIGFQEDVFLGGFQAISKGAVPYIGPASVQYGPGVQLLSYLYMRHAGTFSVVGFRESWAMFQVAGATILFVVFFLAFGYRRGLIATLVSVLVYPALPAMGFQPGGSYNGMFGWPDPLRYAGAIALILLLPRAIRRYPARGGLAAAAALGALFGAMSYLAQENLVAGAVGVVVVSALLLLTGSSSVRSVVMTLLAALGGFLVVCLPVLGYYAARDVLGRFLQLYFLIPLAVAGGYSNTPFGGSQATAGAKAVQARWDTFFYTLPFLLAVLALLVVVRFRPLRVAWEWSGERLTLAATVIVTILLYQGALLRSDAAHLYGTMLAVPGLAIMTATAAPRLLGAVRPVTLGIAGIATFAASFLLLPRGAVSPASVGSVAVAPYRDRWRLAAEPTPPLSATIASQRVGAGLAGAPQCCRTPGMTMPGFITLMNRLHAIIGDRTAYVATFPDNYPGAVYFAADLTPAPVPLDVHTMVMNTAQLAAYRADFPSRVLPTTAALVTASLGAVEAQLFRHFDADTRVITLTYPGRPPAGPNAWRVYVLLRS
jgi:hypothetical protein